MFSVPFTYFCCCFFFLFQCSKTYSSKLYEMIWHFIALLTIRSVFRFHIALLFCYCCCRRSNNNSILHFTCKSNQSNVYITFYLRSLSPFGLFFFIRIKYSFNNISFTEFIIMKLFVNVLFV